MTTCKRCRISVSNDFKPCFRNGEGTDILFIGEAPGHTENKTKIPFTGKSGLLLKKFVNMYGLMPFSMFTNVIKCQPPRNRNPYVEEIVNCTSYLVEDVEVTNPKIIICVGATSTKVFVNDDRFYLKKYLNKPFTLGSAIVIPIYHPSYILRESVSSEYITSFNLISEFYNAANKYYNKRRYRVKYKD